ncbi:unnamed protein product [Phaeothamnion confervicola]
MVMSPCFLSSMSLPHGDGGGAKAAAEFPLGPKGLPMAAQGTFPDAAPMGTADLGDSEGALARKGSGTIEGGGGGSDASGNSGTNGTDDGPGRARNESSKGAGMTAGPLHSVLSNAAEAKETVAAPDAPLQQARGVSSIADAMTSERVREGALRQAPERHTVAATNQRMGVQEGAAATQSAMAAPTDAAAAEVLAAAKVAEATLKPAATAAPARSGASAAALSAPQRVWISPALVPALAPAKAAVAHRSGLPAVRRDPNRPAAVCAAAAAANTGTVAGAAAGSATGSPRIDPDAVARLAAALNAERTARAAETAQLRLLVETTTVEGDRLAMEAAKAVRQSGRAERARDTRRIREAEARAEALERQLAEERARVEPLSSRLAASTDAREQQRCSLCADHINMVREMQETAVWWERRARDFEEALGMAQRDAAAFAAALTGRQAELHASARISGGVPAAPAAATAAAWGRGQSHVSPHLPSQPPLSCSLSFSRSTSRLPSPVPAGGSMPPRTLPAALPAAAAATAAAAPAAASADVERPRRTPVKSSRREGRGGGENDSQSGGGGGGSRGGGGGTGGDGGGAVGGASDDDGSRGHVRTGSESSPGAGTAGSTGALHVAKRRRLPIPQQETEPSAAAHHPRLSPRFESFDVPVPYGTPAPSPQDEDVQLSWQPPPPMSSQTPLRSDLYGCHGLRQGRGSFGDGGGGSGGTSSVDSTAGGPAGGSSSSSDWGGRVERGDPYRLAVGCSGAHQLAPPPILEQHPYYQQQHLHQQQYQQRVMQQQCTIQHQQQEQGRRADHLRRIRHEAEQGPPRQQRRHGDFPQSMHDPPPSHALTALVAAATAALDDRHADEIESAQRS